jgi:excisionase family DNA binding protein
MMKTKAVPGEFDESAAYMSRSGVARLLGVSPNTVTRWAREGRLPSQLTLGGHHRFERSVIESLRSEMRQAGPAETAGLRVGDVIMRVNGERVSDVESFYRRLWAQPVNQPLELSVWRDGTLETIIARPRDRAATVGTPPTP